MADVFLSAARVCELANWHPGHLRKLAGRFQSRQGAERLRNGKCGREYLLSSLPREVQEAHMREKLQGAEQTSITVTPSAIVEKPARVEAPRRPLIETEANLKTINERYRVIEPLLAWYKREPGERRGSFELEGETATSIEKMFALIARKSDLHARTIRRWFTAYKKDGRVGLAKTIRGDREKSRFLESHPRAAAFVLNEDLAFRQSSKATYSDLVDEWPKLGYKSDPPSYNTVRRFLAKLPKPLRVLAHEGEQAYYSKCRPTILRNRAGILASDWYVSDHRQSDVFVRNTSFAAEQLDAKLRLWTTRIDDWGSKKIIGLIFNPIPSSRTINSAIRMAVRTHGFPRNFYWDNGKDYQKVHRALLMPEASRVLQSQGVGITRALAYSPSSKPIESFFTPWSKRFDRKWHMSYCGNNPSDRPEACRASEKLHDEFLAGKRASSPLPTTEEFMVAALEFALQHNETPRKDLGGKSPSQVFDEQLPEVRRRMAEPRALAQLFFERDNRIVHRGGTVELDKWTYHPAEGSFAALDAWQGKPITVARDSFNLGDALAFDPETGEFVGELQIQPFIAQDPSNPIVRDEISAALRKARAARRGYMEYQAFIAQMGIAAGWPSPSQRLIEQARARMTGTHGPNVAAHAPAIAALPPAPRSSSPSPFPSDSDEAFLAILDKEDGR